MSGENAIYLAKHRINTAKEDLETAIDLLKMGRYKGATNRAYYAIFHSMRAVLALEGVDFKKLSGVIAFLDRTILSRAFLTQCFPKLFKKPVL